jgi:hypothetical protein
MFSERVKKIQRSGNEKNIVPLVTWKSYIQYVCKERSGTAKLGSKKGTKDRQDFMFF